MRQQILAYIFIIGVLFFCSAQSEGVLQNNPKRTELDSLNFLYNSYNLTDSVYLSLLFRKSNLHYDINQIDSVLYCDRKLLRLSSQIGNKYYKARANRNLGFYYSDRAQYDSAFFYLNRAKKDFEDLKDSLQVAMRLQNIAIIKSNQSDFFGSNKMVVEQLRFLNSKDSINIPRAYNRLALNYKHLKKFDEALKYHKMSIEMVKDSSEKLAFLNNLSLLFQKQKKFDAAIILQKKLLQRAVQASNQKRIALLSNSLAFSKMQIGGDSVLPLLENSIRLKKKLKMSDKLIFSYINFGTYFLNNNDSGSAKRYFDSARVLSKKLKVPKSELSVLREIMRFDTSSLAIRNRYIQLKDSIYESELDLQSKFAKMEYDDELEKIRLTTLETETAQKELQLAQQQTQKILFLSLSAMLLMGGVSLYFLLRQRHKKEKLKEVYKTEKRISQNLHDGLGNTVFGLMTKVQTQNTNNEELLNGLEKIYQTTRTISHENAAIATEDFSNELKNLIRSYQYNGTTIVTKGLSKIDWTKFEEAKLITMHRAINELLVNMVKHSKANLVLLQFETSTSGLRFFYTDNGIGVDAEKSSGIGLKNTENRILTVGGQFKFESEGRNGVKATISIPI